MAVEQRLQVAVDAGDRLARLKGFGGELADHVGEDGLAGNDDALALGGFERPFSKRLGGVQVRRPLEMRHEAPEPARRISVGVT